MLFGRGFWAALWQCASVYYACAALLHFVVPQIFPVRRIQSAERKRGEVERDAFCSLGPIILKAGIWTIVEVLHDRGLGKLYDGPVNSLLGISYLLFVILLLDVLHDTWFYWTHRLLHWKPLYTHVHYMHHRSRSPTAFTGYSFHIIEAAIVFANEIIVCFLFPIHVELHRAYHMVTSIIHQGGHAGYEMAPFVPTLYSLVWLVLGGYGAWPSAFNTVQHHDLHHRYPRNHFSLYFTHWDRLLGTIHPKYYNHLFKYF